jgi:hypothetical protein
MMPENPYVFVAGCRRSGTTLLQRMLDSHPQLAVSDEANVVPRSAVKSNADPKQPLTKDLVDEVVRHKFFGHLGLEEVTARALAASSGALVEFVRALLDEFAQRREKPFAGDKAPDYCLYLPSLHRLFPTVRSINIIRDGRDVALATLGWMTPTKWLGRQAMWREEPVAMCALYWRRLVLDGRRGRDQVGSDRCLEIRYEELVRAPEAAMRSIAAFLDLPFDHAMVEYYKGRTRDETDLSSTDKWLPPTAGLRDWREELSPRDLQLFEALAGDTLASLGYPLATEATGVPPQVKADAERLRRWWDAKIDWRFVS